MKTMYMTDHALQYFPRSTKRSAVTQLRRWIVQCKPLQMRQEELSFHKGQRIQTPLQHQAILDFLGAPGEWVVKKIGAPIWYRWAPIFFIPFWTHPVVPWVAKPRLHLHDMCILLPTASCSSKTAHRPMYLPTLSGYTIRSSARPMAVGCMVLPLDFGIIVLKLKR